MYSCRFAITGTLTKYKSQTLPYPERQRVSRRPVCAGGLHHGHPPVRGPGQQLVPGRALSGGQRHQRAGRRAGRLQLRH